VGRGKVFCGVCHQNFTRRWNADRHNDTLHRGQAEIVTEQGFVYYSIRSQVKTGTLTPESDEDTGEILLHDALEGIGNEFQELEQLLSDHPAEEKVKFLGQSVFAAITSRDPKKKIQDTVRSVRRGNLAGKMIFCVGTALKLKPEYVEEKLKKTLELNARHSGR
jgi:hypothetical protein